jgi:hypothetical protein
MEIPNIYKILYILLPKHRVQVTNLPGSLSTLLGIGSRFFQSMTTPE